MSREEFFNSKTHQFTKILASIYLYLFSSCILFCHISLVIFIHFKENYVYFNIKVFSFSCVFLQRSKSIIHFAVDNQEIKKEEREREREAKICRICFVIVREKYETWLEPFRFAREIEKVRDRKKDRYREA